MTTIRSRIIKTEPVAWKKMQFIQDGSFKEHTAESKAKLKESLIENGFALPFNVWLDEASKTLYCLDGYHREQDLKELEREGVKIPELLPATFIECKDIADAAKLVLVFSSQYATITQAGLNNFIGVYDIPMNVVDAQFSLLVLPEPISLPAPSTFEMEPKDKPATLKITFERPEDVESFKVTLQPILDEKYPGAYYSVSCGEM